MCPSSKSVAENPRYDTNRHRYIHSGNSKFGSLTIENLAEGEQSSLKYNLYIDGEIVWNTIILSPPVEKAPSSFWDKLKGN